jgi:NTE family protein
MKRIVKTVSGAAGLHGVGLALSGGGARGAYQLGCWEAMIERGIRFEGIAGSSIGALNAALIAQGDLEAGKGLWAELAGIGVFRPDYRRLRRLGVRLGINLGLLFAPVPKVRVLRLMKYLAASMHFVSRHGVLGSLRRYGVVDPVVLERLLDRWVDMRAVLDHPAPLFVTAYRMPGPDLPRGRSVWFRLQDYPKGEARRILFASMSLPLVFPPVEMRGESYRDGGVIDWAPIRPLLDAGFKKIVVVSIKAGFRCDPDKYPDCRIVVIKPDRSLGRFPVATLRFTETAVKEWMELGYADASRVFNRDRNSLYEA